MDSDFDITLNPAESSEESSPKGHFLESLGLGGRDLFGGAVAARGDVSQDDGMVLSSLPDDLGFPMTGSSPERGFMASVRMEPSRNERVESISLPLEDEPQPEPDESIQTSSSPAPDSCDPDETLHLHCPECRGSLVLKRLHLGVEGACVWCHTPIVAAESSRDGIVRVFPILGHAGTPSSQPSPAADPRESAKDFLAPAVVEEAARPHTEAPASENTPAPAVEPELPSPAPIGFGELTPAQETASASLASGGFEYSAAPAPKAEPVPGTGALPEVASFGSGFIAPDFSITTPTAPAEEPSESSSDLESLYEIGGFLAMKPAPSQEVSPELHVPREMPGFDGPASSFSLPPIDAPNLKPMATVEAPAATVQAPTPAPEMAGFGSFLQMPQANPEQGVPSDTAPAAAVSEPAPESGFHTPTPWGPPTPVTSVIPAAASPTAATASTPDAEPKATGAPPSGFASGFGALSPLPESATPAASAPAPKPEPSTAPSWEAAFGSASAPSGIDLAPVSTPAAGSDIPKGFGETFLGAGFAAPSMAPLSPDSTDAAPAKREDEGISIRPSTATKVQEEAKVLDEPRSFVPPFHAFATGSSSDDSPGGARNLFGDPASSTSLWGAGDQADEAPALLAPLGEPSTTSSTEPLFSPEESPSANPFAGQGGAATSLYADFRVADPDAPSPETGSNPQPDAVKGPPALPTSAAMPAAGDAPSLVATTGAVAPAMPTVTSQPLGSKPKPKVRKGFVVLMVVIVGFASGAALASFVLPVEEYVAAARAFMESKLGTGAAVPQMPALPEGLTIPAPATPPVDVQP